MKRYVLKSHSSVLVSFQLSSSSSHLYLPSYLCFKIFSFYFSCCGAGTAADTEYTTKLISANIGLHSLNTGRQVQNIVIYRKPFLLSLLECYINKREMGSFGLLCKESRLKYCGRFHRSPSISVFSLPRLESLFLWTL